MSFPVDVLASTAIELQRGIGHQDRFQRLITTLRQVLECNASTLLHYNPWQLVPLVISGLAKGVLDRRFTLEGHPRLEVTARAGDVVHFPVDNELPDLYGGLTPGQEGLKVHACVGLLLFAEQSLIGVLMFDGMQSDQFDVFSDEELRLIVTLAAGALSNALLIGRLENQDMPPGEATPFETVRQAQMIGLLPDMTQLREEIETVAISDPNVLIGDETRTGKELVAEAIHEAPPRVVNPLVYLNYATLPENVAESGLLGYVKGAFTNAISNHSGKFEMVGNGMLFLDEIGELSLIPQAKLLRVLQYGDIQRVGDDRSSWVDVRVLMATNRDLREEVLAGRSRANPLHRLSAFPFSVPPLHERGDDVILLVGHFHGQCRSRLGLSQVVLSAEVQNLLQYYNFPGNTHELEYAIHRMAVLTKVTCSGDEVILEARHFAFPEVTLPLPEVAVVPVIKQNLRGATEAFRRETIRQALAQNHHNQAVCTWMLETDIASLHRLAKRLGLKD